MAIARSTPAPLLDAVRLLRSTTPELASRLEIVFAGPLSADEAELLADEDVAETVRTVGALERPRALELQRAADALLVITEGSTRRSVATGKLFEYLAARRPILVLGDETEAARIVADAGAGFAAAAGDPEEIAAALRRLLEADSFSADRKKVDRYAYPKLAEAFDAIGPPGEQATWLTDSAPRPSTRARAQSSAFSVRQIPRGSRHDPDRASVSIAARS